MATGATEFIDSTTIDAAIPEIWGGPAIVAREAALVFARKVDLRYKAALRVGDILNVLNITNLTAQTKTKANNSAITYETQSETNTQITVATWCYSAIGVESIVDYQAYMDMAAVYAPKQGYALGLQVDDTLAGHPDDFSNATGTLAATSTFTDYKRARQYLQDANAFPASEWCFIVSPAEENGLLDMKEFVHNDYATLHGSEARATELEMAYSTSFLRTPVYVTTNVEGTNAAGHDNALFHREAIALILQKEPRVWTMTDIDYFVRKIALEQLYGSAILRNDHGVFMRGA